MEKYRSTADPSTGIHPFLPPKTSNNLAVWLSKPLILLRFPVLCFSTCVYLCLLLIPFALSPVPALAYQARRWIDFVCLTPVLFALSVWSPTTPQLQRPRVRTPAANRKAAPARGDVIFVNHASPLDIIFLARAYSPVFVVPLTSASKQSASDSVVQISMFDALRDVSCAPSIPASKPKALSKICDSRVSPVVVLAEGCASNGAGVLRFLINPDAVHGKDQRKSSSSSRVFALGISYSTDRCEARPLGSPLRNIIYFLTLRSGTVNARVAAVSADVDVQQSVASLAGVPALSIGRDMGFSFYDHWQSTQS